MSQPREGQQVAYIGNGRDGLAPGQGRLLAVTGSGGHVKWATGPAADKITYTDLDDLVAVAELHRQASVADPWEDSLHVGALVEDEPVSDDEWLFGG